MLNNLPSDKEMRDADPDYNHPYKSHSRPVCLRRSLNEDTQNLLWKKVFKYIKSQYPKERTSVILYHSLPGFSLWPHTDFKTKKETTVYYLTDKEIPDIGTAIFVAKKEFEIRDPEGTYHCNPDCFDIVKIAPFIPNGYMKFKRSDISFHGVLPCPVDRWAIYFTRYL